MTKIMIRMVPIDMALGPSSSCSHLTSREASPSGPLLASFFLISGLSYKSTFNRELRISSFPLYSI
jgi:hypothetical protein